ncbi:MAG: MerR family transcriptional regulator [Chitinophagales bacterium]|nr:MerR family transcriptional regulator [Chitinophagales bacterium]
MERFSVTQLAKMAGVSVRTLHHYDEIGLLKPALRADSGYRYYSRVELLKLQQILFYKELDIPLNEIAEMLDEPEFDILTALQQHKQALSKRLQRLKTLLQTIDRTIVELKNENMNYDELYKGFPKEKVAEYEKSVVELWGQETLNESRRRVNAMTKEELQALMLEADIINKELVRLMNKPVSHNEVQALIARHYSMTCKYHDFTLEAYKVLGGMYVADERFRINYNKYHTGLAAYLNDAITFYCNNH